MIKRITITLCLVALFCLGLYTPAPARQSSTAPASAQAGRTFEEMVPMRDGVKLSTVIYLPEGKGPWPVVLERTPYGKTSQMMTQGGGGNAWTSHGFAFVVQDVRGMFKSEGQYRPFTDDAQDGYDTVEWAATRPWSTGKVGMFGASAMGITTNMAAMTNPPHLVAGFVMVARSSIYHQSSFMGGVFRREMNESWLKLVKSEKTLTEMYEHSVYDGYTDSAEMYKHWGEIRIPIYNFGGWYDIFNQGNIDNFVGLQTTGGGMAAGNQKLIMGPWAHGVVEQVKYPANAGTGTFGGALSLEFALRWFDYWLKGIDNGIMDEPPVRYYVMGDTTDPKAPGNEWRTAASWPVPSRTTSFFLGAGGTLSEKIGQDAQSVDTYQYDPKNPVPTVGGGNLFEKKGPMDQRAIGDRKDVLKYTTAVLSSPVEVTGRVGVELWVDSDAPDTDFMAKLVDVYPDGTERLVLDSAIRARFREGFDHEVFMKKGEVYKVNIDLWSTSIIFNKGHRIAIHVSSSNNPRFDPNPNTGKRLRADSETRVATNSIHHDWVHPSRALLPVVPPYAAREAMRAAN